MDGYVIGMTAHSSPIKSQHLKQQNILLFEWKARIHEKKNLTKQREKQKEQIFLLLRWWWWWGGGSDCAVAWQLTTDI